MNASDESGDVDAPEQLTGSWLRRAMTGRATPRRSPPRQGLRRKRFLVLRPARVPERRVAARRKNAETDARALLGETTDGAHPSPRHRPAPVDTPPPALLAARRRSCSARARLAVPAGGGLDELERPLPLRRARARAPAGDDSPRRTIPVDRLLRRARDAHRRAAPPEAEAEADPKTGGGLGRVARAPRRCRVAPPRRRSAGRGITETPLSCDGPEPGLRRAGRASRAARVSRRKEKNRTRRSRRRPLKSPESLAFDWCAFAADGARSARRRPTRARRILEDPNALDALSLRARAAQVRPARGEGRCELMLFLVPFAAASVATAARDAARQSPARRARERRARRRGLVRGEPRRRRTKPRYSSRRARRSGWRAGSRCST